MTRRRTARDVPAQLERVLRLAARTRTEPQTAYVLHDALLEYYGPYYEDVIEEAEADAKKTGIKQVMFINPRNLINQARKSVRLRTFGQYYPTHQLVRRRTTSPGHYPKAAGFVFPKYIYERGSNLTVVDVGRLHAFPYQLRGIERSVVPIYVTKAGTTDQRLVANESRLRQVRF